VKRPAKPPAHRAPSLFQEPERPAAVHTAFVDGAARGNPGPAAYAVIVQTPGGSIEFQIGKYLGRATNNVAEYYALIGALDYAHSHRIERLAVRSDSELLVRQMQGRYKVKSPDLRPLHERAQKMARALAHFDIRHIPREENSEADALANLALDATATVGGTARSGGTGETGAESASAASRSTAAPSRDSRKIRARFSAGALHPLEALDLAEGEVVEISVRKPGPR
jgi:ribonuclease HI